MFAPVEQVTNFSEIEERLIAFWKENKTFEKSISTRSPLKKWTFLDGPPFATGMPHYGSLLSSIPKDLFPRYWTMKGYQVRRVWGWDCHGLPAENKVETKLGLKSKREIEEKIGIKKFVDECKLYVKEVSDEWEWYIEHIARWVDFQHAYRTMDTPYMESVMWVFKSMYDKGYIYKGLRVSLYCPHDQTPISNFEVAMDADNYKDVTDEATTYKYQFADEPETYLLAWSTTPWTKIPTDALAVNPDFTYVKVRQGKENYILAKDTLKMLKNEPYEVIAEMKGADLIGKQFIPFYDYYKNDVKPGEKVFVVVPGDFVTADEGTGIVTLAPYGEEDLKVMQEQHVHMVLHLDDEGVVKKDVPIFGGMYYLDANKAVNEDLDKRRLLYKNEPITHRLPTCWRCHTRLYYAPQNAWYVDVQSLKPAMKQTNEAVNWFPKHFKYGRFLKSMEHAPDWNISRSRYWGSPVPVWECECGQRYVFGSIAQLEKASGQVVTDLHRPGIDEVTITCAKCGQKARRVPEVLDSWIEAGSASFAERHFPFNKTQKLEDFFPPDFIVEYTGQIRAWFYVLHVIGAALYDSPAFKNVVTTGVILGTDGRKMSKNYGNYPDPKEMLKKYGGDALRLYLMGSPIMHGEDILISEEQYRNQVRGFLLILWNTYNYFVTYANENKFQISNPKSQIKNTQNVLDRWILSRLNTLNKTVADAIEQYDTVAAVEAAQTFVDALSTWYIRRSRDRVSFLAENTKDKEAFFATTYHVLVTASQIMAPLIPFVTEEIYKNLTGEESVHLTYWPDVAEDMIDTKLEEEMATARKIVEIAHGLRKEAGIKLRQPLANLQVTVPTGMSESVAQVVADEVNVKGVHVLPGETLAVAVDTVITPKLQAEGQARDITREIQKQRKILGTTLTEKVKVTLPSWPKAFEEYITKKAVVGTLVVGETFTVERE